MAERKGLSREHHGEMNHPSTSPYWQKRGISHDDRAVQLRKEYEGDQIAQNQLDVYTFEAKYKARLDELILAVKSGDEKLIDELEKAMQRDYPLHAD